MSNKEFLTDSGYAGEVRKNGGMTPAAEDYLEMIYRLATSSEDLQDRENSEDQKTEESPPIPRPLRPVRICELAEYLHVSPSSASRMMQSMAARGHIDFKRYGFITLTEAGREAGEYLITRHKIVLDFLKWLRCDTGDAPESCFEEAERIEHHLSPETIAAMEQKLSIK